MENATNNLTTPMEIGSNNLKKARKQSIQRYAEQRHVQRIQQAEFVRRRVAFMKTLVADVVPASAHGLQFAAADSDTTFPMLTKTKPTIMSTDLFHCNTTPFIPSKIFHQVREKIPLLIYSSKIVSFCYF